MKWQARFPLIVFLLLALALSACQISPGAEETRIRDNTEVVPQNMIKIGDSYEYTPIGATGHLLCKVTDARIITKQEDCPPKEHLEASNLYASIDGERVRFPYEEWFSEGGAFDHGCRFLMAELTVTNVDAVSPTDTNLEGVVYNDPYRFAPHNFVRLANLCDLSTTEEEQSYYKIAVTYCSPWLDAPEDDPATSGQEHVSFRVQPGETVTFTVGFLLNTNRDGTPLDPSMLMLCRSSESGVETGLFIDLGLGDD